MKISKEIDVPLQRAKEFDMDEFVVSFMSAAATDEAFAEEYVEGLNLAMDAIDVCHAMNKLGHVGAYYLDLDDGPDSYACRAFLKEYIVNSGMGKLLAGDEVIKKDSSLDFNECIVII